MQRLFGGMEAGGSKFLCAVGYGPDQILAQSRFPTTSVQETLDRAVGFFLPYAQSGGLEAIGIGSFGPLDLDPVSPTFGYITTTPKSGWRQVDIRGKMSRALNVPVAFDTDVNVAAFGEYVCVPENRAQDPFLYITVGTGVGVGVLVNHKPLHGMVHPEAGHVFIPHSWEQDPFPGVCPYHGDCLEGLTTGPAIAQRWGILPEDLPGNHPGWDLEARYLAYGVCNLILAFSPQRIVLGGGVLQHEGLIQMVRGYVLGLLNGYVQSNRLIAGIEQYLVSPQLGQRAGICGAIALAMTLLDLPSHEVVEQHLREENG